MFLFTVCEGNLTEDYPSKNTLSKCSSHPAQVRFFLDFIDSNLTEEELGIYLQDHSEKFLSKCEIKNKFYNILQKILKILLAGVKLENLTLDGPNG